MERDSRKLPNKWKKEQEAVKAVQIAFDIGEEVQFMIRREALDLCVTPTDRIRQILGLPVNSKPVRPRLSISLTPNDFEILAKEFNVSSSDRVAIRQIAAEKLIQHLKAQG